MMYVTETLVTLTAPPNGDENVADSFVSFDIMVRICRAITRCGEEAAIRDLLYDGFYSRGSEASPMLHGSRRDWRAIAQQLNPPVAIDEHQIITEAPEEERLGTATDELFWLRHPVLRQVVTGTRFKRNGDNPGLVNVNGRWSGCIFSRIVRILS